MKGPVPVLIQGFCSCCEQGPAEAVCGSGSQVRLLEERILSTLEVFSAKAEKKAGRHSCNMPGKIYHRDH